MFLPDCMLTTERLRLRRWREEDLAAYAALNSDPRVMEFMPKVLNREESDTSDPAEATAEAELPIMDIFGSRR